MLVTDPGRLETSDEGAHLGEWMPPRPHLGDRREVAIDIEVDGARDVPRLVRQPSVARPAEIPAAVDDADARVVEACRQVGDGDQGIGEGHAPEYASDGAVAGRPRRRRPRLEVDERVQVGLAARRT